MKLAEVKGIQEAYQNIYCDDENIFEDIVNFCNTKEIFETIEETEYFANLIIESDLALTFVEDVLEYYAEEQLLDESYIVEVSAGLLARGLKAAGGLLKKAVPAARGLSSKTMVKQGLRPTGLSSKGKLLSGASKADDIARTQAARAVRKPPEAPKANKYADMLAQKKASAPKSTTPKSGGITPSYVAKRGVTDTLATTLALGMGHMAGLKPATNAMRQMVTPVVRSAGKVAERTPPTTGKAVTAAAKAAPKAPKGAAADPWMQFPKKPGKQLGLPKEGPSSRLPNRTLPGSPTPKALPAAGKTSAPKTGLSPEGQAIQRLNKMTGGGTLGTRELPKTPPRAPKPAWGSNASPKPTKTPGTVQRSVLPAESKPSTAGKKPSGTRPTTSGGKGSSGLTHTVRAVLSPAEKTGNMKYTGLEKYATGSGTGSGGAKPPKSSVVKGAATGLAAGAAASAISAGSQNQQKKQKVTTPSRVSNIEKPKKKITGEDVKKSFDTAFATERKLKGSKGTFKWANPMTGKSGTYTTKVAENSLEIDIFDIVLNNLISEGRADTFDNALKIMSSLTKDEIIQLAS